MAENLQAHIFNMPDGTPCPSLLTEDEAARFLRIDKTEHPGNTLEYYRSKGLLKGTYVGKQKFYLVTELWDFLQKVTRENRKENC